MLVKLEQGEIKELHNRNVLLFGAGSLGVRSLEEMDKVGAKVIGFIDNNRSKRGNLSEGYPIYSPDDIKSFPDVKVIITSTYVDEIKAQLGDMGNIDYDVIRLGALRDVLPEEAFFKPLLSKEEANEYLKQAFNNDTPFFAGRLGSNELECMAEYYYLLHRDEAGTASYHNNLKLVMKQGAGFFPTEDKLLDQMVCLYTENLKEIDFIWSMWLSRFEDMLYRRFAPEKPIAKYDDTAFPIDLETPWTYALKGKKVLVIHPFENSIRKNYQIREKIHGNDRLLPDFELLTLKPVQSIADEIPEYESWFEALKEMEEKIARINFDIALIAAGAYGFPLGAYCKKLGKKAFHIGGSLQSYFGIRGKYYDQFGYHNEYWTRPLEEERPKGFKKVEAGRYW